MKLTITSTRRRTVTLPGEMLSAYCHSCGREAEIVSKAQAMRMLGTEEENFDTLANAGQVHTLQTVTGHLLVCKDSLYFT